MDFGRDHGWDPLFKGLRVAYPAAFGELEGYPRTLSPPPTPQAIYQYHPKISLMIIGDAMIFLPWLRNSINRWSGRELILGENHVQRIKRADCVVALGNGSIHILRLEK